MSQNEPSIEDLMSAPDFDPEQQGARFWYGAYLAQRQESARLQRGKECCG